MAVVREHHRFVRAEAVAILVDAVQPPSRYRGAHHVNFDLIAGMDFGDLVFESMAPLLRGVEL